MTQASTFIQKKFWLKCVEIFCLFLVLIGLLQGIDSVSKEEYNFVYQGSRVAIAILVLLAISMIIAFFWQRTGKGVSLHQWFQGIIIYYVAFSVSTYGFAKILKTQFQPPLYVLDTPIGELEGFWLTWVYYGHSQTLAYMLGSIQIGGSILLLFKKTRLLGAFVLLPVMVNIILINHFYDISPLAYFNSVQYTLILFLIMLMDYDKLKILFAGTEAMSLTVRTVLLNVCRVLTIGAAFITIWFLKHGVQAKTKINGSWNIQSIAINNINKIPGEHGDSVFARIYFEWRYGCLFRYNANKSDEKDLYGEYKVDEKKKTMVINFFTTTGKKPDSAFFHYMIINDSLLNMVGKLKSDSISMKLKRVK